MKSLEKKIDLILWAFIWLLPFFAFFVAWFRIGSAPDIITFLDQFSFPFIKDIIDNVWNTAFNSPLVISNFLSYLVAVEIGHVMFDVIVFIPRFAHDLVDFGTHLGRKEKR